MGRLKHICKDFENIENYEKAKGDNFKGWDCHHRLETHTPDGERMPSRVYSWKVKKIKLFLY